MSEEKTSSEKNSEGSWRRCAEDYLLQLRVTLTEELYLLRIFGGCVLQLKDPLQSFDFNE